jgi:two-component system, NtrC family, sensor kinase
MLWQPFVIFFLIRYIRRNLNKVSPVPDRDLMLKRALYVVAILFVFEVVKHLQSVTVWLWYIMLFGIIIFSFIRDELSRVRSVMIAILPFVAVSFASDVIKAISRSFYYNVKTYFGLAIAVTVTWAIAMLFITKRQQKALEKEQKQRQEEEEKAKLVAARKAELEVLVAERTAELTQQKEELENALEELKTTQNQLIQSEKMASLGELTAGIAHEIQNPLNFVNNFSEVSAELLDELKSEYFNKLPADDKSEAEDIIQNLTQNLEKITFHGKRADGIVKGMLQHSRSSTGVKEPTDVNALADEYLRLSYHGLRAKDKSFNVTMETKFDESLPKINVIPQDLGRVILNLFTNAFYSVNEKNKQGIQGYNPTVSVTTSSVTLASGARGVEICVRDNGLGIPQKVLDKIYQPFFSTKPTGKGTGLGLSISYEIITKGHGGELKVETKEGEFAEFIIILPLN